MGLEYLLSDFETRTPHELAVLIVAATGAEVAVQLDEDLAAGATTRLAFFRSFTYPLGSAGPLLTSAVPILKSHRAARPVH